MLVRRSHRDPKARAYYFAYAPTGASLAELAGAAGPRWTNEECFLRAKETSGSIIAKPTADHGWHRNMTLGMAAARSSQDLC